MARPAASGRRPASGMGIGAGVRTMPTTINTHPSVSIRILRNLCPPICDGAYMIDRRFWRNMTGHNLTALAMSPAASTKYNSRTPQTERGSKPPRTLPLRLAAVSGAQLKAAQIRDFNDLQQLAPSLLVSTGSGDTSGGLVRIRGVGTTGNNAGLE